LSPGGSSGLPFFAGYAYGSVISTVPRGVFIVIVGFSVRGISWSVFPFSICVVRWTAPSMLSCLGPRFLGFAQVMRRVISAVRCLRG